MIHWADLPNDAAHADRIRGHVRVIDASGSRVELFDAHTTYPTVEGQRADHSHASVSLEHVRIVQNRRPDTGVIVAYSVGSMATAFATLVLLGAMLSGIGFVPN
jgi:hypothetical protein